MSKAVVKSLTLIPDHNIYTPKQFAILYFPDDHPGWQRIHRCGNNGSGRGGGLWLWAGGWLGKLKKQGLIYSSYDLSERYTRPYQLTPHGIKLLNQALICQRMLDQSLRG